MIARLRRWLTAIAQRYYPPDPADGWDPKPPAPEPRFRHPLISTVGDCDAADIDDPRHDGWRVPSGSRVLHREEG